MAVPPVVAAEEAIAHEEVCPWLVADPEGWEGDRHQAAEEVASAEKQDCQEREDHREKQVVLDAGRSRVGWGDDSAAEADRQDEVQHEERWDLEHRSLEEAMAERQDGPAEQVQVAVEEDREAEEVVERRAEAKVESRLGEDQAGRVREDPVLVAPCRSEPPERRTEVHVRARLRSSSMARAQEGEAIRSVPLASGWKGVEG